MLRKNYHFVICFLEFGFIVFEWSLEEHFCFTEEFPSFLERIRIGSMFSMFFSS